MENRLFELEEKAEEVGLDALFAGFDPASHKKSVNQEIKGAAFNPQQQLTDKLDKIFSTTNKGVEWDDDELASLAERNAPDKSQSSLLQSRSGITTTTGGMSTSAILARKGKPKAIEVFEETCKNWNEKSPAIFKGVKHGRFELKEITLTEGQTHAFQEAAKYFGGFADRLRFNNNNFSD